MLICLLLFIITKSITIFKSQKNNYDGCSLKDFKTIVLPQALFKKQNMD